MSNRIELNRIRGVSGRRNYNYPSPKCSPDPDCNPNPKCNPDPNLNANSDPDPDPNTNTNLNLFRGSDNRKSVTKMKDINVYEVLHYIHYTIPINIPYA